MQENMSLTMPTSQDAATSSKGLEEISSLPFEIGCEIVSQLKIFKWMCKIASRVAIFLQQFYGSKYLEDKFLPKMNCLYFSPPAAGSGAEPLPSLNSL